MPWLRLWALPVLPVSWSFTHWMELSPSWVDEESWLRSALSPSCSPSCVTCAMAGMAATASIAKSAANNINFFNLPTSLYSRGTVFYRRRILLHKGPPPTTSYCSSTTTSSVRLAASRRGLIDLLVTGRRVRAAHVDRRADLLKLKVISLAGVLDDGEQVLGVARVRHTLDIGALVRVVALLGGREVLVNIGALAFLLFLLGNLGYGR